MLKAAVYLDTTVPSAYYDGRAPDRQRLTEHFWRTRLPDFEPVISVVVLREIQDTPDPDRRSELAGLVDGLPILPFNEEADALTREYLAQGVFPQDYEADANHVAIAVVNGIQYLASWNFKHLVRVATRRRVNLVNALVGYGPIEIVAPPEL